MRKNKRKNKRRAAKRGGGSMLASTTREQYAVGNIVGRLVTPRVNKLLSVFGANLDDAVTRTGAKSKGVRRRATDEDKVAQAEVKAENKRILSERSADMDRATDGLLTVDPTGQKPVPENRGSIYALMGDSPIDIKATQDKGKGAGTLLAAQAVLIASYLGTQNLLDEDPEDGKTVLEKLPEKAKEVIAEDAVKVTEEGGSFASYFSAAAGAGLSSFFWPDPETGEEKEYKVALATDNPDIELVPQKRVQRQEGGAMEMPPEMMAAPMTEVPEDTYPNATPEEIEAAQAPDEEMEGDYLIFILNEALVPEEQEYLMQALEGDPQLSQIFDKVVETASEFSGSGEVQGPGDGISDSIPARLSDGEFVMTQKATEQIGADNLQTMMDDAERAYDGGMMRKNRYLGGVMSSDDDEDLRLGNANSTDADIRKLMSVRANKTPSLR